MIELDKFDDLINTLDRDIILNNVPTFQFLESIVKSYDRIKNELEYQENMYINEELTVLQAEAPNLDKCIDLLEEFRYNSQNLSKKENDKIIDILIRLTDILDVIKE